MRIKLPDLPYSLDALEPFMSKDTVKTHYQKHHKTYAEKTNKLIQNTEYRDMDLEEIVRESFQRKDSEDIYNNAAQFWNHNFFWPCLTPDQSKLPKILNQAIEDSFGSVKHFTEEFKEKVTSLFGSGWVWVVKDSDGVIEIMSLKNAESPLNHHRIPLLACDVWEHAYYLDFKNERERYFENYWEIINWEFVDQNFRKKFYHPEARPALHEDFMGIGISHLGFS